MTFNSLWFAHKIIYIIFYRNWIKIDNVEECLENNFIIKILAGQKMSAY